MLIISAGMQKSGSAYFYNVINDLVSNSESGLDSRQLKVQKKLDKVMLWHNNNVGKLRFHKLIKLWWLSSKVGDFTIKTHHGPSPTARLMSKFGMVKIVYSYRDPRDVLLSGIDHGRRIIENNENHTFAEWLDLDKAIQHVKGYLKAWKQYSDMDDVLSLKYEDMIEEPDQVAKRIESFLGLEINLEKRKQILWKYSKDNPEGDRKGMHFNKAQTSRYETEMSQEERILCEAEFGDYLSLMGYLAR